MVILSRKSEFNSTLHLSLKLLLCSVVLIVASCNLYLVPQRGRENVYDQDSQIRAFKTLQFASDEVVTSFAWLPPKRFFDEEERVQEVRIFKGFDKPNILNFQPWALGDVESVTYDKSTISYAFTDTWDNVQKGDEVWFTLYYRTERGWLAPLYERVKVLDPPPTPATAGTGMTVDSITSINFDTPDVTDNPTTNYPVASSSSGNYAIAVYFFEDLQQYYYYDSVTFNFEVTGSVGDPGMIAPLYSSDADNNDIRELIDDNAAVSFNFANTTSVDVTEVVNRASMYGTNAIVLYAAEPSSTNVAIDVGVTPSLDNITYYSD